VADRDTVFYSIGNRAMIWRAANVIIGGTARIGLHLLFQGCPFDLMFKNGLGQGRAANIAQANKQYLFTFHRAF
jgi:hypothetical protein